MALAVERFGGLDILVNNAGYGDVAPIEDTSLESFRRQIETNLFGTIIVTKAALPLFRQRRSGRFRQISSSGGRAGAIGCGAYSAAKFGVEGLSEVLAQELRPFGAHVTIVEPGGFQPISPALQRRSRMALPIMPRPSESLPHDSALMYEAAEATLAATPPIAVPTITIEGDASGVPAPPAGGIPGALYRPLRAPFD